MKKSTKILLYLSVIFLTLGVILILGSFAFHINIPRAFKSGMYDFTIQEKRTNKLSKGGNYSISSKDITELNIDWVDGNIIIEPYDGSKIKFKETSTTKINEKNALIYKKKKNSLTINHSPSHFGASFSIFNQKTKNLHIYLPEDIALNQIKINIVDSNTSIKNLDFSSLIVDDVDGNLTLSSVIIDNLDYESVDGNLTIKDSQTKDFKMESISGSMDVALTHCPESIYFDSVDGDANIYLPDDSEFTVDMDFIDGDFNSDFNSTIKDNSFTTGSGSSKFTLETIDGSVNIKRLEKKGK